MGLAGRKEKQKIGDDPRNTKWAKNESNPGFKILSSMGWTPSITTLGPGSTTSTGGKTGWKRLPGAILPVIKTTTSGLGANPAQASSSTYLSGAPRFVRASQASSSVQSDVEACVTDEKDPDQSAKIAIVSQGGGGGFDDLLSRLNHSATQSGTLISTLKPIDENDSSTNEPPLVVLMDKSDTESKSKSGRKKKEKSPRKSDKKKRVRILELCSTQSTSTTSLENDLLEEDQPKKKKSKKNSLRSEPKPSTEKRSSSSGKVHKSSKKKSILSRPSLFLSATEQTVEEEDEELVATSSGPIRISRPINPRVAARAKFIRSKKLASSAGNAQAMAEILGIAPPA
ncbi:hypothetical protein VP01_2379g3 [Puccinia sorghi]|uniref:G-patch domain-containing protein n=1 Tax=Puccinia sorghi TaxID=27349 RepID=A0A0L6V744_9BASI|nr:hypothetical protein VP01_2379g3 [Puccinia sorghi]